MWHPRVFQMRKAGSGAVPSLVARRRESSSRRWSGGVGGGGLHRLALRGGGDQGRGLRSASRRAGRHAGGAGSQASRQDGSHRRSSVARSPRGRGVARELDPARRCVGVAGAGAAVSVAGEPAHGVVSAHSCRAVSTRGCDPGGCDPHTEDTGDAGRRFAAVVAGGASAKGAAPLTPRTLEPP